MKYIFPIILALMTLVGGRAIGQAKADGANSGQTKAADAKQVPGSIKVVGTVYDRLELFAMPGVSVFGTSGQGTQTDSTGHYSIRVSPGDSVYFSYLGKFTGKFPVKGFTPENPLNISLAVTVDSLPLVVVRPKLYRYDSLENRDEYRKVFDFQPDGSVSDMLFNGKRNRQMLALQQRLIEQEEDKYVDHRFNKILVKKITGLRQPDLDIFMHEYRPSYFFIRNCENDYEFYKYIKDCGLQYVKLRRGILQ